MKYYRIRTRTKGGLTIIIKDKVSSLKRAYECIIEDGKGTTRKYYIDEIEPKLFSKLSVRDAENRLEEMKNED